jgi:hypothetical protein
LHIRDDDSRELQARAHSARGLQLLEVLA